MNISVEVPRSLVLTRAKMMALEFQTRELCTDPIASRLKFPRDDAEILARLGDKVPGPNLQSMISAARGAAEKKTELAEDKGEQWRDAGFVLGFAAAGALLLGTAALVAVPVLGAAAFACTSVGKGYFRRQEDAQYLHSALEDFSQAWLDQSAGGRNK